MCREGSCAPVDASRRTISRACACVPCRHAIIMAVLPVASILHSTQSFAGAPHVEPKRHETGKYNFRQVGCDIVCTGLVAKFLCVFSLTLRQTQRCNVALI